MSVIVLKDLCTGCGSCIDSCPTDAISMDKDIANIDKDSCTECGICADNCPTDAITFA